MGRVDGHADRGMRVRIHVFARVSVPTNLVATRADGVDYEHVFAAAGVGDLKFC